MACGDDTDMMITSVCVRALIKLAGVTLGKRRALRRTAPKIKVKMPSWTKATTTPLVRNLFESFFSDQIEPGSESGKEDKRSLRCGVCDCCQRPDCGVCKFCRDMVKFGGSGRAKQCCIERRCPNRMVAQAEEDEQDEDLEGIVLEEVSNSQPRHHQVRRHSHRVRWLDEPVAKEGKRTYYKSVDIDGQELQLDDCVTVEPDDSHTPVFIARINHMWEDGRGVKHFHADWFHRGSSTVLGETADPLELFITDDCEDTLLDAVIKKVSYSTLSSFFILSSRAYILLSDSFGNLKLLALL